MTNDEATGEQAYKPVLRLFRNKTEAWCEVTVEVKGKTEIITSTPGHKYYLPWNIENREIGLQQEHESYITLSEKWVSACKLKAGDKVLLSDGKYGIVKSVKIHALKTPGTTYNFEVEDFHTYYVGENPVCVHNAGCSAYKKYTPDQIAEKYDISVEQFHKEVKPEILRQCKPSYKVGSNPDIMFSKTNMIAYQGAKGVGFQETGLNMLDILSKLNL